MEVVDTIEHQINEIECLRAMFCEVDEFEVDESVLQERQKLLDNDHTETKCKPSELQVTIRPSSKISSSSDETKFVLQVVVPLNYPKSIPKQISLSASHLTKNLSQVIVTELQQYLAASHSLSQENFFIMQAVEWVQQKLDSLQLCGNDSNEFQAESDSYAEDVVVREWLYSHHIYSKTKRHHILNWARALKLTGFSLCGKPGVICVEGHQREVDTMVSKLKSLTWKKLQSRLREEPVYTR